MKLKTGDQIMYGNEMFTVVNVSRGSTPSYVLLDSDGGWHPDGPFTKQQLRECPVK